MALKKKILNNIQEYFKEAYIITIRNPYKYIILLYYISHLSQ